MTLCKNHPVPPLPKVRVCKMGYCDYKKIPLGGIKFYNNSLFLHLTPSELSKLIYRFHIWITVTGIVRQMLDFKGSRKRKKQVILSKIREYRRKGYDVLYSELRVARLNKGAYIPAMEPQNIIIGGVPFNLVEIEFQNYMGEISGAILKLKIFNQ